MGVRDKVGRPAWLLLVSVALWVGFTIGIAVGEPAEPPQGLVEEKPATPTPMFSLPDVNGEPFDSATLQGKVVVVRFWATW